MWTYVWGRSSQCCERLRRGKVGSSEELSREGSREGRREAVSFDHASSSRTRKKNERFTHDVRSYGDQRCKEALRFIKSRIKLSVRPARLAS